MSDIRKTLILLAFFLFFFSSFSNVCAAPSITLYEPQNITYNTSYVPLNFTVNETVNVTIFVDNAKIESECYVNITYNKTECYLTNIDSYYNNIYTPSGTHYLNITVYNNNGSDFKEVWFVKNVTEHSVYISTCGVITAPDIYYLVNDIIDSNASRCISIKVSDVRLDCQWHKVDGIDASNSIGIFGEDPFVVVENCVLSDWSVGIQIWGRNTNLTNIVAFSNYVGIEDHSSEGIVDNVTSFDNYYGIQIINYPKELRNSIIRDNSIGIYLYVIQGFMAYNNIFNNTNNFVYDGALYANYFNTTKQPGVNIWNSSLGYIGGNAWFTPDGTGYSETSSCHDTDCDGFCDNPYVLVSGYISDYLPIAKTICQYPVILSVVFSYNSVDFGTVTPNIIAEAKSINYNVSITTNTNYKVSVNATDWSGPTTIPTNTLYFAVNDTLDKLSFSTAKQLSNAVQLIATFPSTVTTNYHGFYFNVPIVPQGTYTSIVTITYEVA